MRKNTFVIVACAIFCFQGLSISIPTAKIINPPLEKSNMLANPIDQFMNWYDKAKASQPEMAGMFFLATASSTGIPSGRSMLLKDVGPSGFVFYSSSHGFKAQELKSTKHAAMTFYWPEQQRQINIRGTVEMLPAKEADAYFKTRSRKSQIASWASAQGKEIVSKKELLTKYAELENLYEGKEIPTPSHWTGYRVVPQSIEFWQAGRDTLHDRVLYQSNNNKWSLSVLSP